MKDVGMQKLDNNNEKNESPEIPKKRARIENKYRRQTIEESIDDLRETQRGILEKLETSEKKTLEELRSIREQLDGKGKISITDREILEASKSDANGNSISLGVSKPNSGKCFVLKHVFENVSKMKQNDVKYAARREEYFGCPWNIFIERIPNHVTIMLVCKKSMKTGKWSIDTEFEFKVRSKTGKNRSVVCRMMFGNFNNNQFNGSGSLKFLQWENLLEEFLVDDKLTVEVHMKINKTTGIYGENWRSFDQERYSDVVLVVGDRNFYVSKLFLANQSTYFDALFLGQFQESKMTEITLSDVDPDDFQKFLEVLYGDPAIDEASVEGILLVADMYDTRIIIEKCEDFLMEKSEKSMKKKLEMAARYNLDKLKEKCLSEIKTVDEIQSILPSNLENLDHSIIAELLKKSLSLH